MFARAPATMATAPLGSTSGAASALPVHPAKAAASTAQATTAGYRRTTVCRFTRAPLANMPRSALVPRQATRTP